MSHLEVHSWGGLGSQLFALAFVLELQQEGIKRDIDFVLHSGGVTRRSPELSFIESANLRRVEIDDFKDLPPIEDLVKIESITNWKSSYRKLAKFLLSKVGFLVDTEPPDGKIKSWTCQVRSHYYKRLIPEIVLRYLTARLLDCNLLNDSALNLAVVHYRLGDLLTLKSKNPLEQNRMRSAVTKASRIHPNLKWKVASDSPSEALKLLAGVMDSRKTKKFEGSPWETLKLLASSRVLIASSSKLSVWAIIFGIILNIDRIVLVPEELLGDIRIITPLLGQTTFITY